MIISWLMIGLFCWLGLPQTLEIIQLVIKLLQLRKL